MADGVFHTGYGIEINLNLPDFGHPEYPDLLREITEPVSGRERMLLECVEHHTNGYCRAEGDQRLPWMFIRRRTVGGITTLVAAHLPLRTAPTAEESDKHKAMKDRLSRAAIRHGIRVEQEVMATDRRIRTDVLVRGSRATVGWEAQYSPITSNTVRNRSRIAVEHGITPLWLTNTPDSALINRAPWVRVDDLHWKVIASARELFVRGGVRHLQRWKCTAASQRQCPDGGNLVGCGRFHVQWFPPALCNPQLPEPRIDDLVVSTSDGAYVPLQVPQQRDPRSTSWMWVASRDQEIWYSIVGPPTEVASEEPEPDETLTFTGRDIDRTCRYGEETKIYNDSRPRRDTRDGSGLHTFDEAPAGLYVVPEQVAYLRFNERERLTAAATLGCPVHEIGPCAGCGTAIRRYGTNAAHACSDCRRRVG